MHLICQIALI